MPAKSVIFVYARPFFLNLMFFFFEIFYFLLFRPLFVFSVLCQTALGRKTEVRVISWHEVLGSPTRWAAKRKLYAPNCFHLLSQIYNTSPTHGLFFIYIFYFYLYNPFGYGPRHPHPFLWRGRATFGDDRNQHWNLRAGAGIKRKTKAVGDSKMRIPLFTAHNAVPKIIGTVGAICSSSASGPLDSLHFMAASLILHNVFERFLRHPTEGHS